MTRYLCDTNVWIAMLVQHHVHRRPVIEWFETAEYGSALFCRSTQQSVLRLLTTSALFAPYGGLPLTGEQAWDVYERLAADGRVGFEAHEPTALEGVWRRITFRPQASPKLWMDAYLAAFAQTAGLRLVTTDAAFRQFQDLDVLVLE